MKGQAFAIAAVILCGVATYVMFLTTLDALKLTRATYYAENRFGDVFASLKRAPESLRARIAAIPGVAQVDTRVVADVNLDVAEFVEPVTGRLISISEDGEHALNLLHLRAGRLVAPGREDEVVVSEAFAEAHGLQPGDNLHAILNGRRKQLTLVGTALSPEYIHQLRPGGVFPDYQRYGVMWMGRVALAKAYDLEGAFNDVVLSLQSGANTQSVIDELDPLLETYGGYGAIDRTDQRSHRFLSEEFRQLEHLSNMFPSLFLGVAAFLLNVVTSRLIGMQREQIAALKAFGYGNGAVMWHYLKLVLVIAGAGIIGGIAFGVWLGEQLAGIYTEFFRLPYLRLALDTQMLVVATLISSAAAVAGTLFAVSRAARLRPAEAMRPEAPVRYRVSLIERLGLRRWLGQPTRMILRHIQRRPVKSLLTIIGIAVAAGITMTGRFQNDTVRYMVDVQYGMAQREDLSLVFIEPTSRKAQFALQSLPGVLHTEVFRSVPVRLRHEQRSYRTGIRGVEPSGDLQRLLNVNLQPVDLPVEGVVLTDFLATMLEVRVGDSLMVEVLEGSRPVREVTVAALVKEYLGVSGYMDLTALNRFMGEGPAISGAYLAVDKQALPEIYAALKVMPRVAGVTLREQEIKNFNKTMAETMLFFTYVATLFAMVIAFGVVYNSARIALMERGRELASLRVLGFTRAEISYILLGELAALTLVALPLGLLMGRALCDMIAQNLQTDLYRVPLILDPATYAFAATVVLVSAVLSGLLVRRRLDELDLIAVLKTRE